MGLPTLTPVRFTPRGLVDALDATDKFPGACIALANLVFDPSNPEFLRPRPGVTEITDFPGFASPDVVSVQVTVGGVTYGMIGTARNAGMDEPFAYDHAAAAFIPVSGVVAGNCPTSQATSGPWTPPTMASVGVYLIVTHPGFAGGATKFGWFDLSNPAAPAWNAGDTATNGLTDVPVAVANFNDRAYFAVRNNLEYTDVLSLTRTNGSQALTISDGAPLTALSGLPIQTTSSGVVAALLAFKAFQVWQITGDPATSNLGQNFISLVVGCSAPRSIAQSMIGTYFAGFAGPQMIDQFGILRPVVHGGNDLDSDIQAPYINAVVPSRMAGGYTEGIYRLCMQCTLFGVTQTNDYWFNERRRRWTGPHTFTYDCVSQTGNFFVLCSNAVPGKLFKSEINAGVNTVFTDDSAAYTCSQTSSTFPKLGNMMMKQVVESTIELPTNGAPSSYTIAALGEDGAVINSCQVSVGPSGSLWGTAVWGAFVWASARAGPRTYTVPWTQPLLFQKMALQISAVATAALLFGTFFARYQDTGYMNVPNP